MRRALALLLGEHATAEAIPLSAACRLRLPVASPRNQRRADAAADQRINPSGGGSLNQYEDEDATQRHEQRPCRDAPLERIFRGCLSALSAGRFSYRHLSNLAVRRLKSA